MKLRRAARTILWLAAALLAGCADTDSPVIADFNPPPEPPPIAPDTLAPEPVNALALRYDTPGSRLTLEWTAPDDDTPVEPVSQYEIRYALHGPFAWDAARVVIDPPLPAAPGEHECYLFIPSHNGESLYCAIRCVDEAGNRSPVSAVAAIAVPGYSFEGRCMSLSGGEPVADLPVTIITAGDTLTLVTAPDGIFRADDLRPGPMRVMIEGSDGAVVRHDIDQRVDLVTHTRQVYPMIHVRATIRNPLVSYLALFRAATEPCTGSSTLLLKWKERPVRVYIPHWVNGQGIDYRLLAANALLRWEVRVGLDLFTLVEEPPEAGVIMHFKTRAEMGSLIGITRHSFDEEGYPSHDDIDIVDDFADATRLYRVMLHELGHTIRLCHLNFRDYIMYPGQPLPPDISDDEAEVVRMYEMLPNGIDMSIYVDTQP